MVLAFSLQSDIKSIGAYAGFAAIIGLALLVILYFAQAREIHRMSDWLEQQEERLRNAAARAPMPMPRQVPAAAVPQMPLPAEPPLPPAVEGAAPIVTVAVPGVRRVSVGSATPTAAQGPGPPADELAKTVVPGTVAAATVAGAMAGTAGETAAESPPARPGDAPTVVAPKAGARAKRGRPVVSPAASQDPEAPGPATATPGSAVPLAARLAPTAEPVRATASLDEEAGTDAEEAGADTSENDVAEPGTGRPDAEATFEPEPGREISADRLSAPAFGAGPGSPVAPAAGDLPAVVAAQSPALGPSTPAGARPRFPPAPAVADMRATPVGAPLRGANGAAGEEMLTADAGVATTRRRARERPSEADDGDSGPHAGGSAIRLLIAAVVIVAVLIFIATRVFGSGSTPKAAGPPPATVTVAVLNGTHSPGLAGQVAAVLTGLGFKRGLVGNALSQGHRSTLVGYVTPASRAAALTVAKDLVPTPTRVGPVDAATLAVAEAQGGTPDVVVTIGSRYTGR